MPPAFDDPGSDNPEQTAFPGADPAEVASYIAELTAELQKIAAAHEERYLAHLLSIVVAEARARAAGECMPSLVRGK